MVHSKTQEGVIFNYIVVLALNFDRKVYFCLKIMLILSRLIIYCILKMCLNSYVVYFDTNDFDVTMLLMGTFVPYLALICKK